MKALRKLFFGIRPTWPRVLLFAAATAVVTALALIIPAIADTSISNIGVAFECWFVFALLIILNCEKPLEAGMKTFVFFLVSQPLIYLLQVPFYFDGWRIFNYYPRWGLITLLTFPGAMVAWYVKKDKLWSALILSVATAYLAGSCVSYFRSCVWHFPYGLAAGLFCGVFAVVFILVLLKNRKARLLCAGITVLAALIAFAWPLVHPPFYRWSYPLPEGHDWVISYQQDSVGETSVADGDLVVDANRYGTETLYLEDENGEILIMQIEYSGKNGVVITMTEGNDP